MRELTMRPSNQNGYSNGMEKTLSETPLLRSEVERGQKEASSELLEAITSALRVPLWFVLREVSERMAIIDGAVIPDAVPDNLVPVTLIS